MKELEAIMQAVQTLGDAGTTIFIWWCVKELIRYSLIMGTIILAIFMVKQTMFRLEWNTRILHRLRAIAVPRNAEDNTIRKSDVIKMEELIKKGKAANNNMPTTEGD